MSEHRIKKILRKHLKAHEYKLIEPRVNMLLRNRAIRREFNELRPKIGARKAIMQLAEKYFLSEDRINTIVYCKDLHFDLQLEMNL